MLNLIPVTSRNVPADLLYFKCKNGHFTRCNTPKHHLVYCKECKTMYQKKDCERYTDRITTKNKYHLLKSKRIEHSGISLYKFTESRGRNYRNEYWKRIVREGKERRKEEKEEKKKLGISLL